MKNRKLVAGVSLFLVVSTVMTWLVFVTLRRDVQGPTNSYAAIFTDVSGLDVGDDVRVAGVRVGRVDSIDLTDNLAKVTFRVQRGQTVYDDTVASVTYQNIIGQRYIGLAPGNSPDRAVLGDGQQIPVERTRPSFDISYLLRGFEPLFSLLDPELVDNLTNGLIEALQGQSGSVLSLITQTSALAETLAGPDAVLGDLIKNLDDVTGIIATQRTNIREMIQSSRDVMDILANRRDELIVAVGSINEAVTRLAQIMDGIYPSLNELITREPGFVAHVTGPGRDRLSMFGTNLISVWKDLARASQSGTYMDAYVCDINSTIFESLGRVIPGIVKLASPGNTVQHSPICSK